MVTWHNTQDTGDSGHPGLSIYKYLKQIHCQIRASNTDRKLDSDHPPLIISRLISSGLSSKSIKNNIDCSAPSSIYIAVFVKPRRRDQVSYSMYSGRI